MAELKPQLVFEQKGVLPLKICELGFEFGHGDYPYQVSWSISDPTARGAQPPEKALSCGKSG